MSSSDLAINTVKLTQVPEPTITALLGLGSLALILRRRK
ncbi:MAG: PEP-CTERM sorting domain-containing protein [Akkermansiaceae bacterium]